jgi:hypothetical protein
MTFEGGCHCGAARYKADGEPQHVSVCHCGDCRKSAGAPFVSWAAFAETDFETSGEIAAYNSSGNAMRHFCPKCGTGLYYVNEDVLPGLVDIQTCTLDDPEALAPQIHVQHAERVNWTGGMEELPKFQRYPEF